MSNARGKVVDTTYLSLDTAEERGFIHRDYIAHCMRWSHVVKWLTAGKRYSGACIVDVGCGREAPLAKTLYSSRLIPAGYIGIDYGPIPQETRDLFHSGKFPVTFHEKTDFASLVGPALESTADVVTSFEVLEHVEPAHARSMLAGMQVIVKSDGMIFISTPCWDVVSCAANHVNEMRYEALGAMIEDCGLEIVEVFGTFASIREYEPYLAPAHREAFEDLRSYYDVNFLSCVFAPFYPQYSRNCLWQLRKKQPAGYVRRFSWDKVAQPFSSSSLWAQMRNEEALQANS